MKLFKKDKKIIFVKKTQTLTIYIQGEFVTFTSKTVDRTILKLYENFKVRSITIIKVEFQQYSSRTN